MSQTAKSSCPDDFDIALDEMTSTPDTKPLNRMSQTTKRSCPDDFDKALDEMTSTPDTKPLNRMSQTAKSSCPDDFDKALDEMTSTPDTKPLNRMSQTAKSSCPDDFDKALDEMTSTPDTKPLNRMSQTAKSSCPDDFDIALDEMTSTPDTKPLNRMSQTAKSSCPDDFDIALDEMTSTPDTKPLNSKPRCPTRIAPRRLAYPTESPESKSFKNFQWDIFLNPGDPISELPFESLPRPQSLRRRMVQTQRTGLAKGNFKIGFLVDNHLRQLKKRYVCMKSSEKDHGQDLNETLEIIDSNFEAPENSSEDCISQSDFAKIPKSNSTIDVFTRNKKSYRKRQKETMVESSNDNLTQDNQMKSTQDTSEMKLTKLHLELNSDFFLEEDWHTSYDIWEKKSDFLKIPKSNSTIDEFRNKKTYRKRKIETTVDSSSDNLTQDNQMKSTQDTSEMKLTQLHLELNSDFSLKEDWHASYDIWEKKSDFAKIPESNSTIDVFTRNKKSYRKRKIETIVVSSSDNLTQDSHEMKLTDLELNSDSLLEEDWQSDFAKIPESNFTIDVFTRNKKSYRKRKIETIVVSSSDNLTQDSHEMKLTDLELHSDSLLEEDWQAYYKTSKKNSDFAKIPNNHQIKLTQDSQQIKLTQLDLQLNSDFLLEEDCLPLYSSTPKKEE